MKKIYISFDVVADEIIDSFVRKNDEAAKRDFKNAFKQQSRDDTHVKLFEAYPKTDDGKIPFEDIEGIPVKQIWDSIDFEEKYD